MFNKEKKITDLFKHSQFTNTSKLSTKLPELLGIHSNNIVLQWLHRIPMLDVLLLVLPLLVNLQIDVSNVYTPFRLDFFKKFKNGTKK